MTPTLDLLVNLRDRNGQGLLVDFNSQGTNQQGLGTLFRNDGESLRFRALVPSVTGVRLWDYVDLSTAAVRIGVGLPDQLPTSGTFYLEVGAAKTSGVLVSGKRYEIRTFVTGDDFTNLGAAGNASGVTFTATGTTPSVWSHASTLYEITADLAYNETAANVQTALNATAVITAAGGVVVTNPVAGKYRVTFNNAGAQVLLGWNADNLAPDSIVGVSRLATGSAGKREIQALALLQLPYCYTELSTALDEAGAVVTPVQTGDSTHPDIQSILLSPTPYDGTWSALIGGTTYNFAWNETQAAMQAKLGGARVVTHEDGSFFWQIATVANGAGTAITCDVARLSVPIGVSGALATNTSGMLAAFDAAGSDSLTLIFEVEIQFPGEQPNTPLHLSVTITRDVINAGTMIRTPLPDYYTASQVDANFATLAALATEVTRAEAAEATLTTGLAAEIVRAEAAEVLLSGALLAYAEFKTTADFTTTNGTPPGDLIPNLEIDFVVGARPVRIEFGALVGRSDDLNYTFLYVVLDGVTMLFQDWWYGQRIAYRCGQLNPVLSPGGHKVGLYVCSPGGVSISIFGAGGAPISPAFINVSEQ